MDHGDANRSGGARARREREDERIRKLGGGYSSVDAFAEDQLPASGHVKARRRKKEWNPARRVVNARDVARRGGRNLAAEPKLSPQETLDVARAAFAAAVGLMDGIEFVGAVLMRPSRGPKEAGSFKVWVAAESGTLTSGMLGDTSTALRDALWDALPGRPGVTIVGAGQSRPLFSSADFERFRGSRAQLTLREPLDGRRRLVGEACAMRVEPAPTVDRRTRTRAR